MDPGRRELIACRILADLLVTDWDDLRREKKRPLWPHERKIYNQLIVDDLVRYVGALDDAERHDLWQRVSRKVIPIDLADGNIGRLPSGTAVAQGRRQKLMSVARNALAKKRNDREQRERVSADIIILTILPVERDAVLVAFGQNPGRSEDWRDGMGNFYYKISFESRRYDQVGTAWLAMVGRPRNVPCATFVERLGRKFDFENIVLLGIAGGNKHQVSLGDVVTSTSVLDLEGGVDQLVWGSSLLGRMLAWRRKQERPLLFDHEGVSRTLLDAFVPDIDAWRASVSAVVGAGNQGALKFGPGDGTTQIKYKSGLMQAGERLKRDGSLPKLSKDFHDKLYAVEMEGSGFAQACRQNKYEWMIFRGISDFGDPKKRDNQQALASVAAAGLLKHFLSTMFKPEGGGEGDDLEF